MDIISDIEKIIRKGPEIEGKLNSVKLNTKSIARGAKDSTFQFPCLIADTVPVDMANTIARTLDQVYATFTQTWLSMNSMFDITVDPTPLAYLKKLHQNLKLENTDLLFYDEGEDLYEHMMSEVYDGKYRLYMNEDQNIGLAFSNASLPASFTESNRMLNSEYLSEYNLTPIYEADLPTEADFMKSVIDATARTRNSELKKNEANTNKTPTLVDRDIKKTNDMTPYGVQVRLIAVNDKKQFVQYVDFIIGVKTILHIVTSEDMIQNIGNAVMNKSLGFKFLKWTTGEISLFKDIILNINDMKSDVVNKNSGRSPFFGKLKRLKNQKVGIHGLTSPHVVLPNSTIIITSIEAATLLTKYGIDVHDNRVAGKVLSSLFLMAFGIIDEGTGTLSIIYDGDDAYQTYALETLERDNTINSNKLGKEIGRMIAH